MAENDLFVRTGAQWISVRMLFLGIECKDLTLGEFLIYVPAGRRRSARGLFGPMVWRTQPDISVEQKKVLDILAAPFFPKA
jgi:hypothetical protein